MQTLDYSIQPLGISSVPGSIRDSFDSLPADRHLSAAWPFRYRRYARARSEEGRVDWQQNRAFIQSATLNRYAGGSPRHFEEIEEPAKQFLARDVIPAVAAHLGAGACEVGVHQIRITADDDHPGKPAPEGTHRDGFDYVMVLSVGRENVCGGVSLLMDSDRPDAEILFEKVLLPGDAVLFDDRRLYHYTTPIMPKFPGRPARRDVFVLTFSQRR